MTTLDKKGGVKPQRLAPKQSNFLISKEKTTPPGHAIRHYSLSKIVPECGARAVYKVTS
jgi:hypothetical protein